MLGRKCRRRHLLADPHFLRNDADKSDEPCSRCANQAQDENCKTSRRVTGARKDSQVGPRIEIVLYRQQENVFGPAALDQLGAIGVPFPAHVAEQVPVGRAKRDQVTPAAMIGAENKFLRRQLSEGTLNIERAESWTIPADRDYFIVTEFGNRFDRVLKTSGKVMADLAMNQGTRNTSIPRGGEKVNVDRCRKFRAERGKI